MLNFGRKKRSYADRLRGTSVAPGMVAPTQTSFGSQLNDLSEFLNTNNNKTMRTSQAPDMSSMRVLGDPVDSIQGPARLLPDPKRAPRTAGRVSSSSGVSNVRPIRVGGLETRGVRPVAGSRRRPISPARGPILGPPRPGPDTRPILGPARPGPDMRPILGPARPGPDTRPILGPARPGPDTRPILGPPRPVDPGPPPPTGKVTSSGDGIFSKAKGLTKSKNFKRNALIGAGVIAAASVVQSRRGDGTSRGRQSNYRY